MNLNISFINKINNIIKLSSEFDIIFNKLITNPEVNVDTVELLSELIQKYIITRAEHGTVLLIEHKNLCDSQKIDTTISDEFINKMYDISTFKSIIEQVNMLITNMDYQFKKMVSLYPSFINKSPLCIVLVVDNINKDKDKNIKMINELKEKMPENMYKVIESDGNDLIKCGKIFNRDIKLKTDSKPALFIIDNKNIIEIPIAEHTSETLYELLKQ